MTSYPSLIHQTIVSFVHANASAIAVVMVLWVLVSLLNLFLGRKTQIESWVAKNPNRALLLRTLRGYGCDPWLLANAAKEYLAHELTMRGPVLIALLKMALRRAAGMPPLVLAFAVLPLLSGCAGTLEESRGQVRLATAARNWIGNWFGLVMASVQLTATQVKDLHNAARSTIAPFLPVAA